MLDFELLAHFATQFASALSRGCSIRSNGSSALMILAISASIAGKSASVSERGSFMS